MPPSAPSDAGLSSTSAPITSAPIISAVILTRNERDHIAPCIAALRPWVQVVIVWDSGSTDGTREMARACGAQVVYRSFDDYARQRQAALDSIAADWLLFVDADERFSPELGREVHARLRADASATPRIDGYWLPRRNFIAGRETRGGGFYPDYQLRLLRRGHARYAPRAVHEIAQVEQATAQLLQPLLHFNYRDWPHFHRKQPGYAHYEATVLAAAGIRPRPHNFVLQPLREFRRRFITLGGYRDGLHGLRLAAWLAYYYGFLPYRILQTLPPQNQAP